MWKTIREHREAAIIVVLFVILATVYSLATPLFEASDEISHYPVVQYIATVGRLPIQQVGVETLWEQEGSQPPLYYLIGAGLTFWIDTSDIPQVRWRNPHAKIGLSHHPDNKNMVIHTDAERFPWRGTALAVHLLRFFSVGLGAVSVTLTYLLARTIWPERRWVPTLAMALVAFNPMFLFITGSVNNDNLMVMLGSWVLLLVARILKEGLSIRRAATLAVVAALGTITKVSGLTLLPLIGLALLIHALRSREWGKAILTGLSLLVAWLVLASWWYIRNLILYGELTGTQMHIAIVGGRQIGLIEVIRQEYLSFWVAYWAWFGAVNILADWAVYNFYTILSGIALAGLVWWAVRRVNAKAWQEMLLPGLMALQVGIILAAVIRWTMMTYASQGRLMFPVIGAIGGLMALGLLNWLPERFQSAGALLICIPMLGIAAISPFRYIIPAYAPPPYVEEVPDSATPVGAHFGGLELVAIETESVTVAERGRVPITLYWRANRPLEENYSFYLHALGRDYHEIGKIDTYPGGGKIPATLLEPGAILEDRYTIVLDDEFATPTIIRVLVGVGLLKEDAYQVIHPTDSSGQPRSSVVVEAGVAYPYDLADCTGVIPPDAIKLGLAGDFASMWALPIRSPYHVGESVPVTLYWDHNSNTPAQDLTVFVHLIDQAGEIAAQADGPPLGGDYPTRLWRYPCQVEDVHLLDLPDSLPRGGYRILVGLYDAGDPSYARVPITQPDGSPYPNGAVPVGTIFVEAP